MVVFFFQSDDSIRCASTSLGLGDVYEKQLQDGAMVISKRRIKAAGCILPVSHKQDIPKELGLRHRAAMGISQDSDALAVIVSEETGRISVALRGEFQPRLSAEQLESILTKEIVTA